MFRSLSDLQDYLEKNSERDLFGKYINKPYVKRYKINSRTWKELTAEWIIFGNSTLRVQRLITPFGDVYLEVVSEQGK